MKVHTFFTVGLIASLALLLAPACAMSPAVADGQQVLLQAPSFPLGEPYAGWEEVGTGSATGGGISNTGCAGCPLMAVGPDGALYVAWSNDTGADGGYDNEIYLRRWNGSAWEEFGPSSATAGGVSNNAGESTSPAVAVAGGTVCVVWRQDTNYGEIYGRCSSGGAWEELGGSATGGGISDNDGPSSSASITFASGTLYVAWLDSSSGNSEVYVRRWGGSGWEEVGAGSATAGGVSDNGAGSGPPVLATAPDGTVYVAWSDQSYYGRNVNAEIYVRRWNGGSWEEVGANSATGGGISDNAYHSYDPAVAIAPDGTPYVAWYDYSCRIASGNDDTEIYVRRWNGSVWEEVGACSATGPDGISYNVTASASGPAAAIAPDGTPYVAWNNPCSSYQQIYVRRWNGAVWEEVGEGSASCQVSVGRGISDNGTNSVCPALEVAPSGRPYVAWGDGSSWPSAPQVYVRRAGGETSAVKVVDEGANPLEGARVYRNGKLAGATTSGGTLAIFGLQTGDQLAAKYLITETATVKGNHSQDSTQNWAYRVYVTSVDIDKDGNPSLHVVGAPGAMQTLTVKKSNTLVGFNVVAAVGWDASASYLDQLRRGFESASGYLYDAGDGQLLFERVTIYDNKGKWADADYKIHASNQTWPEANMGGILRRNQHVFLGRYFDGQSANQGAWTQPSGYRTQVHEFGHYGLYLGDEYYGYETYFDGFEFRLRRYSSTCTLKRHDLTSPYSNDAVASSLMDRQFRTTEFCSDLDVNPHNPRTDQHDENGASCWDTIVDRYDDSQAPARWQLQTPVSRGQVAAGPTSVPVTGWTTAEVGKDANSGVCGTAPSMRLKWPSGKIAKEARVVLRKADGTLVLQGKTDGGGNIVVLGAANGDKIYVRDPGGTRGNLTIACAAAHALRATGGLEAVILELAAFSLDVTALPGGAAGQVEVRVKASTALSGAPQVRVLQSGASAPVVVAMAYEGSSGAYVGALSLDSGLPPSGDVEVSATDIAAHTAQAFEAFSLSAVTASENVTIYSADGQVQLYLPAGSLAADGVLGVALDPSPGAPPEDWVLLSGPYTIRAGSSVTLTGDVALTLRYLDTGGSLHAADLSSVQIYRWDDGAGQWLPLTSTLFQDHNEVSASINTFGMYAALAEQGWGAYLPLVLRGY